MVEFGRRTAMPARILAVQPIPTGLVVLQTPRVTFAPAQMGAGGTCRRGYASPSNACDHDNCWNRKVGLGCQPRGHGFECDTGRQ